MNDYPRQLAQNLLLFCHNGYGLLEIFEIKDREDRLFTIRIGYDVSVVFGGAEMERTAK